jgi:glycine dehydrogenase subunit 1
VTQAIVRNQGIELVELPYDRHGGHTDPELLEDHAGQDYAALVVSQPNFFGVLEDADALTDWAHRNGILVVAVVNPVALALLQPPGAWGREGADICCGEGQPLGVPLSSGGPYFGFMCCKSQYVRQMPGRIIGRTRDLDGNPGYTLTLQAREQHIRRSKATSNICTNQGLMVTAATIHMALLGSEGLERVAAACHANAALLVRRLGELPGVAPVFDRPVFHERVLRLPAPAGEVLRSLAAHNVLGGYDLGRDYPELGEAVLVCATEVRTEEDIDGYASKLARIIAARSEAQCPVQPKT